MLCKMWDNPIFSIHKIYLIKFTAWTFREGRFTWGLSRLLGRGIRSWDLLQLIFLLFPLLCLGGKKRPSPSFFVCFFVLCCMWGFLLWMRLWSLRRMRLFLIGLNWPSFLRWLRVYLRRRLGICLVPSLCPFLCCVLGFFLFLMCCL